MLNFIKYHWFGLIISIFLGLFFIEFFLVLFSPHQDSQNRGFVPCTYEMAEQIESCNNGKFCILKAIAQNYVCDGRVIITGFSDWMSGKQPRPWSNYIFTPDSPQYEDDEKIDEYYQSNPDIASEMTDLKQKHDELENKKNEQ